LCHRVADVIAARVAYHQSALLRQPVEPEGGEEHMQQAGVIAVLYVFDIELPVAGNDLAVTANKPCRRPHDATDARHMIWTTLRVERRSGADGSAADEAGNG